MHLEKEVKDDKMAASSVQKTIKGNLEGILKRGTCGWRRLFV